MEKTQHQLNESILTLTNLILVTLLLHFKGKNPLTIPIEFYQNIRGNIVFKKIIKRLAKDPEVIAAAKNPKSKGWRKLIASKLTDEEKGAIDGLVWTGSEFKRIGKKDFDSMKENKTHLRQLIRDLIHEVINEEKKPESYTIQTVGYTDRVRKVFVKFSDGTQEKFDDETSAVKAYPELKDIEPSYIEWED